MDESLLWKLAKSGSSAAQMSKTLQRQTCRSVRMLLTAEANHNTCLGEITAGSARVLKGLCDIKPEVTVQAVTAKYTRGCVQPKKNGLHVQKVCVFVCYQG
ncbi:hypothetical protein CRENBAI_006017 [Crenichthys baileyi]|uniref:Uncharacterized protein n=1 Tax=Crenichthys baileyi TaxID=28760 RepID=A0AAV9QMK2_9TELE